MTQVPPNNDPNNPQQGYPPPGMTPPPGYPQPGYPPAGYPPPDGYPQPMGYAPQPNIQPEPPASGSLVQAWAGSAIPNRRRIASWAQAGTPSWTTNSIVVAAIIAVIGSVIGSAIIYVVHPVTTIVSNGQTTTTKTTVGSIIAGGVSQIISSVRFLLLFGLFLALFMPATFGPLSARFQRALKPVVLAAVGVTVVGLIFSVLAGVVFANIAPNLEAITSAVSANPNNPDTTAIQNALGPVLGFGSLLVLLGILYGVYALMQYIQSGSVGSTLNRWAVFGTMILAGVVAGIVGAIISIPLGLLR